MKPPTFRPPSGTRTPVDDDRLVADTLVFLGEDAERLDRFLATSGLAVADLRRAARSPAFAESLLDYLCGDERLLVAFADEKGYDPAAVERVRQSLAPPPFEG